MLSKSTIQLLRFPFSLFLMPVYWFAVSQVVYLNRLSAVIIFIILHLLVYPASNGYNSYMDRDESSIGGLKSPLKPTKQLYYVTIAMDMLAILFSLLISVFFTIGIIAYILASRAYSYRGIRLKKFPVTGYLTVVVFQGAITFLLVYHGASVGKEIHISPDVGAAMIAASLLIGGFYPLTQIYQHAEDRKDGVKTISSVLGYKGTFLFSGAMYLMATFMLAWYFFRSLEIKEFFVLATCMLPIAVYFMIWAKKVWRNPQEANFVNTMRMTIVGSTAVNIGFILVLLMQ